MTQASDSLGQFPSTKLYLLLTPAFLQEWGSKVRTSPGDGCGVALEGFLEASWATELRESLSRLGLHIWLWDTGQFRDWGV